MTTTTPTTIPPNSSAPRKGRRLTTNPKPLGKVWSFDLVTLPHNAIRLELRDLNEILRGLVDGPRTANVPELSALFAWYSTFEAFVVTYLKAEEEVIFPWIEQWGRIDGALSTAGRITTKGSIIRGIRDAAACAALVGLDNHLPHGMVLTNPHRTYYDSLKVGLAEVKPTVAKHKGALSTSALHASVVKRVKAIVDTFSALLLEYFDEQERSLPMIIDSLYDEEDMHAASIERRVVRAMWKCGRKDECMIILMRAVDETPFQRQWTLRNVKRVERFAMPLWKRKYSVGRGAVTAKFRQRNLSLDSLGHGHHTYNNTKHQDGNAHSHVNKTHTHASHRLHPHTHPHPHTQTANHSHPHIPHSPPPNPSHGLNIDDVTNRRGGKPPHDPPHVLHPPSRQSNSATSLSLSGMYRPAGPTPARSPRSIEDVEAQVEAQVEADATAAVTAPQPAPNGSGGNDLSSPSGVTYLPSQPPAIPPPTMATKQRAGYGAIAYQNHQGPLAPTAVPLAGAHVTASKAQLPQERHHAHHELAHHGRSQ